MRNEKHHVHMYHYVYMHIRMLELFIHNLTPRMQRL